MKIWVVVEKEKDIGPEENIRVLKAFTNKEKAKEFIKQHLRDNENYEYFEDSKRVDYFTEDGWHEVFAEETELE